jgi:hypothetical protein
MIVAVTESNRKSRNDMGRLGWPTGPAISRIGVGLGRWAGHGVSSLQLRSESGIPNEPDFSSFPANRALVFDRLWRLVHHSWVAIWVARLHLRDRHRADNNFAQRCRASQGGCFLWALMTAWAFGRTSKGEHWFCTEQEALGAGWRRALR